MGVKGGRHWVACVPTRPYLAVAQPAAIPEPARRTLPLPQPKLLTHLPCLPLPSSQRRSTLPAFFLALQFSANIKNTGRARCLYICQFIQLTASQNAGVE